MTCTVAAITNPATMPAAVTAAAPTSLVGSPLCGAKRATTCIHRRRMTPASRSPSGVAAKKRKKPAVTAATPGEIASASSRLRANAQASVVRLRLRSSPLNIALIRLGSEKTSSRSVPQPARYP